MSGPVPGDYGITKALAGAENGGVLKWQTAIIYPANVTAEGMRYFDWALDLAREDGTLIPNSHYFTGRQLISSLSITVPATGQTLSYGTDYTLRGVSLSDFYGLLEQHGVTVDSEQAAINAAAAIFYNSGAGNNGGGYTENEYFRLFETLLRDVGSDGTPLAIFEVQFNESGLAKLRDGRQIILSYSSQVDESKVEQDVLVRANNLAMIPKGYYAAFGSTTFREKLQKQISRVPYGYSNGDFVDGDLSFDLGDTGGVITYRILLYDFDYTTGGEELTDTLPAGMELLDVMLVSHDASNMERHEPLDTDYYLDVSKTQNADGTTALRFTLSHLNYVGAGKVLGIYYSCSVANDPNWAGLPDGGEIKYQNRVEWDGESDSAGATVTKREPSLAKAGEMQTDESGSPLDVVRYYVTVNPSGADLVPNEDYITLSDVISTAQGTGVTFLRESVHVYRYNAAADHGMGTEIDASRYQVSYEAATGTITFTLPDGEGLVVVYDYEIDRGSAAGDYVINNTVTLEGRAYISSGDEITIEHQDSSATANKATLRIYKVDAATQALLPGAQFKLERYQQQGSGGYAWTPSALAGAGADGYFTINDEGYFELSYVSYIGDSTLYNTLYKLTEVTPPEGYTQSPYPIYFVWMEYGKTPEETVAIMEKAGAIPPEEDIPVENVYFIEYSSNVQVFYENIPDGLTVEKKWQNREDVPITPPNGTEAEIILYQWSGGVKTEKERVTLSAGNGWKHTWYDLPRADADGQPVTYTVEEVPLAGWSVTYSPTNSGEGVSFGTITVYNTPSLYTLPETGGGGSTLVLILAGATISAALGAGLLLLRGRRREGRFPH